MERIGIDILGPLTQTSRGNRYMLVISGYFSKWTGAYAMKNIEASERVHLSIRHTKTATFRSRETIWVWSLSADMFI